MRPTEERIIDERRDTPMKRPTQVSVRLSTLMHKLDLIYHEIGGKIGHERFAELEQFVRIAESDASKILSWIMTEAAWRGQRIVW